MAEQDTDKGVKPEIQGWLALPHPYSSHLPFTLLPAQLHLLALLLSPLKPQLLTKHHVC